MSSFLTRAISFSRLSTIRAGKYLRNRLRRTPQQATAVFVVGSQRSGTTMLMRVLEEHPDTWVFHEHDRKAFEKWRLRGDEIVARLIKRANCPVVAFKSLYDSHRVPELLERHGDAKAIWIVRQYQDVVRSSVTKWGAALLKEIRRLATERPCGHWMYEALTAENRALVEQLYHEDMTVESAAGLRWYLRNSIYFDHELDKRDEVVLLLHYEDLMRNPLERFPEMFEYLGLGFQGRYVHRVFSTSVGKGKSVSLEPAIEQACIKLSERFAAAKQESHSAISFG